MRANKGRDLAAVIAIALLLAACNDSKERPASQTAAKVNGDEVTVHQINAELQRMSGSQNLQGAQAEAASKRILESLIDQTLLVQQAKESKLDRDPQVLQVLEASKRQILAQAFIDRQAAASPPTQDEIKAFYTKYPDLFEQRRVYAFREFVFERGKFNDAVRDQLNAAKSPSDIARILTAAGIRYRENNSTRSAEALPLEALPRIAKMNKGDTIAFTDQNLADVLILLDYNEQPVTMERATPLIQQYLVNQKKREVAQSKVKELREKGKIEYLGTFAKADTATQPADVKLSPPPSLPEQKKDDSVDKGLSGTSR